MIKLNRRLRIIQIIIVSISLLIIQSCGYGKKDTAIEIITEIMDFQMVDEIPAGWNTFRYINNSNEPHFFLVDKYPKGKTIKDYTSEVAPIFQSGMNLINEGKPDKGFAEFNRLPAWYFDVVFSGGSGLVSPGQTAETTIKLEPGYYVFECYVKMSNGVFHTLMGMIKEITVTDSDSDNPQLTSDVNITISSTEGIVYKDPINKGKQTFSVFYKDQVMHENFVGHDVNLVRLNEKANLEELEKWMNWADPKGLITPAPKGITFLGGVNDMPTGSTGYFTVTLEPGNYALISEVPNTLNKNMLKTFVISE